MVVDASGAIVADGGHPTTRRVARRAKGGGPAGPPRVGPRSSPRSSRATTRAARRRAPTPSSPPASPCRHGHRGLRPAGRGPGRRCAPGGRARRDRRGRGRCRGRPVDPVPHPPSHRRPYVVLKLAATADGRTAAPDGTSRWITGDAARADAHRLRAESDAVLVGAGTVRTDDPSLTVRHVEGRDPAARRARAGAAGARVHPCLELAGDLGAVLDDLGGRGVLQVLVEGGATVAHAFHAAGLVDRYVVYLAPPCSVATTRWDCSGARRRRRSVRCPGAVHVRLPVGRRRALDLVMELPVSDARPARRAGGVDQAADGARGSSAASPTRPTATTRPTWRWSAGMSTAPTTCWSACTASA